MGKEIKQTKPLLVSPWVITLRIWQIGDISIEIESIEASTSTAKQEQ